MTTGISALLLCFTPAMIYTNPPSEKLEHVSYGGSKLFQWDGNEE